MYSINYESHLNMEGQRKNTTSIIDLELKDIYIELVEMVPNLQSIKTFKF